MKGRAGLGLTVLIGLVLAGCQGGLPGRPPVAGFVCTPDNGEVPLFVRFEFHSFDPDGTIVFRVWDFGDGTVIENAPATYIHRYDAEGTYYPTLTVRDNQGLSTTARAVVHAGLSYPLDVVEWQVEPIYYGQRVVGRVRNIGERKINIGRVAVRFYDKDWNLVRERSKTLGDIPPGGEQIFEITVALTMAEVGGAPKATIYTEVIHADEPLSPHPGP